MNQLDFSIIDPHIHQWDPYHTPHSAAVLVKALGKYPFLSALAEQPNVHAKISGLMMPVLGHTSYKENRTATVAEMVQLLTPLIQHAIRVFGTGRIMFASNYPMDKPNARLTDLIQAYIKMIEPYGSEALQAIFRQNAIHFYQLDIN